MPLTSTPDATHKRVPVRSILTGLLMGLLVAMLSSSIVSTSLPRIVADVGGTQSTLTWMVTGSLLAITVTTPVWGKLADLLSRRGLVVAALGIFIIGSAVSGVAVEPITMIAGRIIQGAGAGGLLTLTQVVLAEIISPRDRGKYMGLFGSVMAMGTIGGPVLGGLITDVFGWRWNFLAMIPIAVISLIVVLLTLKLPARHGTVIIDYAGALLISAGVSGILVWASLGGSEFEWMSGTSALLLGGSALILVLVVLVEARVKEPIIPLKLFRNKGFVLTVIASLSVGVATYGTAVFMSQYLQLARGASTTESGLIALPQVIAVTLSSTFVGALISTSGNWKPWMVTGASSLLIGTTLLGTIGLETPMHFLWVYMALVGAGIGCIMQNLVLMAEANVDPREVGVATAGVAFFRSLGGTFGVTILGTVLTWQAKSILLDNRAALKASGINANDVDITRISDVGSLAEPLRGVVQAAYAAGAASAFMFSVPLAICTVLAIVFLPSKKLSEKTRAERLAEIEETAAPAETTGAAPSSRISRQ